MAMSESSVNIELVYLFLVEVRQAFLKKFNYQRIQNAKAFEFDSQFSSNLIQIMRKYNSGEKMIKSHAILQDLQDVKNIMVQNLSMDLQNKLVLILFQMMSQIEDKNSIFFAKRLIIYTKHLICTEKMQAFEALTQIGSNSSQKNDSKKYFILHWDRCHSNCKQNINLQKQLNISLRS